MRGGQNLPENFAKGSGVTVGENDKLGGVSVNSAPGRTVEELTAANPATGHLGVPHKQVGFSTVGAIRTAGGEVEPSPSNANPHHATLSGVTAEQASEQFRPTIQNPNAARR